jgi:catechol-2,3-dioxygenase
MSPLAHDRAGRGILELRLEADALEEQKAFYSRALGLPLVAESADQFTVHAGATRLTFTRAPAGRSTYHFAFNIPENKLAAAKEWLAERTLVLRGKDGREVFHYESWNAHGLYFHDPAGNVAELIARHDLPNARPGPFAAGDILYVSEIGLVVDDVPATVRALEAALGLAVYRSGGAEFAAVGDEHRLLILTRRGRDWWGDTPSRPYPLLARLSGERDAEYRAPGYPFTILVQGSGIATSTQPMNSR